jgi:hypothetical protein
MDFGTFTIYGTNLGAGSPKGVREQLEKREKKAGHVRETRTY